VAGTFSTQSSSGKRWHKPSNLPLTLSLLAVGILPSSADPCGSTEFNLREVGPWKKKN
jgi:hypothetical protein